MTYPILDQPSVLQVLFHPRRDTSIPPNGVYLVAVEVEPGITVGGRLYPTAAESPAILYFHGNGEIAADYDYFAQYYKQLGITLLVIDYRGYGVSNGTPTASNVLKDAVTVFNALGNILASHELFPQRLYIMGRSLGSAAAIEVTLQAKEQLAGLIIESGFAQTFSLLTRLGVQVQGADEERDGVGNARKISQITTPTLIIHGQQDFLIPVEQALILHRCCAAQDKQLVLIPNAGHNDLMMVGRSQYFKAIQKFVTS
jgi:alpha-beta hydrolase superfamily lysophospholipase